MSAIGNLLWIVFGGGLVIAFWYFVTGIVLCLSIIGIPFGYQLLKLAGLSLLPFGRIVRSIPTSSGCTSLVFNIIWILIGGIWIALTHLVFAFLCAITIVGIPFAVQHLKLMELSLTPFGKQFD